MTSHNQPIDAEQ